MSKATITPFNLGSLLFDLRAIYRLPPDHPENGRLLHSPIFCYHIALGERSVLVDASAYEPEQFGDMLIPSFEPPPPLLAQLGSAGIAPENVTDVIITHLHFDHFSGLTQLVDGRYQPAFPNARHYLGAGDWRPDRFGELETRTVMAVYETGQLTLVSEPLALGDGLTIVPMPGESRGHQIVTLDQNGLRTYLIGDLFHNEIEFDYPDLNVHWAKAEKMNASKNAFLQEAAASDHQIFIAHVSGPWQVRAAGGGFVWQIAADQLPPVNR